jgi:hypothetical protein
MGGSSSRPPLYGPSYGPSMSNTAVSAGFGGMSLIAKALVVIVGLVVLLLAALFIYNAIATSNGKQAVSLLGSPTVPDQAPVPLDGKIMKKIPAANAPITQGADNGVQFWMFIKDWDYQFGKKKSIIYRKDSTNAAFRNPDISLHETDNSINVKVSIFPNGSGAGQSSSPGAANDAGATGDSFTCTVENVPLQTWFAVSVTVFQRNLDVYINGKLVKSCVLPGVPRPAAGDIVVGDAGGFSGSVCNVHAYPNMLGPSDASAFFSAGTNCASFAQPNSTNTAEEGSKMTLFGYTFYFNVKDASGKVVQSASF